VTAVGHATSGDPLVFYRGDWQRLHELPPA